jgi:hypothetical protein
LKSADSPPRAVFFDAAGMLNSPLIATSARRFCNSAAPAVVICNSAREQISWKL